MGYGSVPGSSGWPTDVAASIVTGRMGAGSAAGPSGRPSGDVPVTSPGSMRTTSPTSSGADAGIESVLATLTRIVAFPQQSPNGPRNQQPLAPSASAATKTKPIDREGGDFFSMATSGCTDGQPRILGKLSDGRPAARPDAPLSHASTL